MWNSRLPTAQRNWRGPRWVHRIYDSVRVLLAILLGAEIGWAALALAHLPEIRNDLAQQRQAELADENYKYCTNWGFRAATEAYARCTAVLDQVRENERNRIERDQDILP